MNQTPSGREPALPQGREITGDEPMFRELWEQAQEAAERMAADGAVLTYEHLINAANHMAAAMDMSADAVYESLRTFFEGFLDPLEALRELYVMVRDYQFTFPPDSREAQRQQERTLMQMTRARWRAHQHTAMRANIPQRGPGHGRRHR